MIPPEIPGRLLVGRLLLAPFGDKWAVKFFPNDDGADARSMSQHDNKRIALLLI